MQGGVCLKREIRSSAQRTQPRKIISAQKALQIRALPEIIQKQLRTRRAVAPSPVVIERDTQIITQRIQLVVLQPGITAAPHLTCADIVRPWTPADPVSPQALPQHAHVKRGIMCSEDPG